MVRSVDTKNSRYVHGGDSYMSNSDMLTWWDRKAIEPADDDIEVTVNPAYAGSPWLISYDLYGDPALLWVVMMANNIIDPDTEIVEGVVLKVPSKIRVMTSILTQKVGGIIEK